MDGKPLQLVDEDENGHLTYNNEVADQILCNEEVINKLVSVISITGSERGGKSFLLNYILRCLASDDPNNRFGLPEQPLDGFPFTGGRKRQTKGILVWSKPLIQRLADGTEIAVILMDTQGVFGKSTANDALILAFCSFVSSIQIYNTNNNFLTNSLEQLDVFLRYARDSSPDENVEVFQRLIILVRDWSLDEYFGIKGGNDYLSELLNTPQNNEIALHIESCFSEKVSCYLMPAPGNEEVSSPDFNGSYNKLRRIFLENLKKFITSYFGESITVKKIAGHGVTGETLCKYFKDCFDTIRHNRPPIRMIESYIKSICDDIIGELRDQYRLTYKNFVCEDTMQNYLKAIQSVQNFTPKRNKLFQEAEQEFQKKSKLKGHLYLQHLGSLKNEFQTAFDAVEESYLGKLCRETILVLEESYFKTMYDFANRILLPHLVTSKNLKEKHESLKSKATEKFDNVGENCRMWCFTRLDEKLISFLSEHEQQKKDLIKTSVGMGISTVILGATVGKDAVKNVVKSAAIGVAVKCSLKIIAQAKNDQDPELNFLNTLNDLVILLERYISVGGNIDHLN
jgi:hypothetical protein